MDHALEFFLSEHGDSSVSTNGNLFLRYSASLDIGDGFDLGLHLVEGLNLFKVDLGLASMSAEQLEHIIEVIHLEFLMQRELHLFGPVFSHQRIFHFFLVIFKEICVRVAEVLQEFIQVTPKNVSSGKGVVLFPDIDKGVDV